MDEEHTMELSFLCSVSHSINHDLPFGLTLETNMNTFSLNPAFLSLTSPMVGLTYAFIFTAFFATRLWPSKKGGIERGLGGGERHPEFLLLVRFTPHESICSGYIALNAIQRRHAKVSTGDTISVSRFIPPDNFNLALLTLELEFVKKGTKNEQVDAVLLATQLKQRFNQVMTAGQRVSFEYHGNNYIFTVNQAVLEGQEASNAPERGLISNETYIIFEASNSSGIKIVNQREAASSNIFRQKEFNLLSLGIGGLSNEFADIFRRAFASRVFPPHVTSKLGIKHVKGMLLYGPPGTGKTLMARQIGKMLNGREPKIINGPEVLSKFVGETEKNVRDLFADAENDQRTRGDQSDLHVIIFDEIDAICKVLDLTALCYAL
ncbi:hypothetical protein SLEP1_g22218 [Rubroshorea leprosula]|uniref:Vesicle-fusing ATPase n=1 Tax=Rubroshorea leprosula TaxID=152421 RepID=A0AAV5J8H3_9ROSI|nr:hypothetical protein SLEP1_g22218 [Rubroshorea leprosula]